MSIPTVWIKGNHRPYSATAGSLSSHVSQGDILLAEANTEIGFTGTNAGEAYSKSRIRDKERNSPPLYGADIYLERKRIDNIGPKNKRKSLRIIVLLRMFQE